MMGWAFGPLDLKVKYIVLLENIKCQWKLAVQGGLCLWNSLFDNSIVILCYVHWHTFAWLLIYKLMHS
jgi:hypothetical protein